MPTLTLTDEDRQLVESVLQEFDLETNLKDVRLRDLVPAVEWDFLLNREREAQRRYVVAALIAVAVNVPSWNFLGEYVDSHTTLADDIAYATRAIQITDPCSLEIVNEYEQAVGGLIHKAAERILEMHGLKERVA